MKYKTLLLTTFYCSLLTSVASHAETTTTTTTTTQPDGSTTTTVEETTTTGETEPSSQATSRNLIGPAGVTGTIRRSERRQDYRREQDLEDLKDAGEVINRRPRR